MKKILIFVFVCVVFVSCSDRGDGLDKGNEKVEPRRIELSAASRSALDAIQPFCADFFSAVATSPTYKGENVACSPMSAAMLLSMLSNAAKPETAGQIAQVLGCADVQALNELYASLTAYLPVLDSKVTVSFANSLWYEQTLTLRPLLDDTFAVQYNADIFARDLTNTSTRNDIFAWLSDKTNGMIKNIDIHFPLKATFINALFFKAPWTESFDASATTTRPFYGIKDTSDVSMMYGNKGIYYLWNSAYEGAKLNFGSGAFSAVFIMPAEGNDIEMLLADNAIGNPAELLGSATIEIDLPKFKIEPSEDVDCTTLLADMGISTLTDPDMLELFSEDVQTGVSAHQKVSVEFDEKGAEAAAVTWTDGELANGPYKRLTFNRPFVFYIIENSTGTTLFAGKIVNLEPVR